MIIIVHAGTGTIFDANDDVWVVDTDKLTSEEKVTLAEAPAALGAPLKNAVAVAIEKGIDIMEVIRH